MSSQPPPLAGAALAALVVVPKEAVPIEAGDLILRRDVPQHLHPCHVPFCRHKLEGGGGGEGRGAQGLKTNPPNPTGTPNPPQWGPSTLNLPFGGPRSQKHAPPSPTGVPELPLWGRNTPKSLRPPAVCSPLTLQLGRQSETGESKSIDQQGEPVGGEDALGGDQERSEGALRVQKVWGPGKGERRGGRWRWTGGAGFGRRGLTVVDEGSRAQPELGALLARGVHDAEVVLPRAQQRLVVRPQLSDAAHQQLQRVVLLPARCAGGSGRALTWQRPPNPPQEVPGASGDHAGAVGLL